MGLRLFSTIALGLVLGILALAVSVLGFRSYWRTDELHLSRATENGSDGIYDSLFVESVCGRLVIWRQHQEYDVLPARPPAPRGWQAQSDSSPAMDPPSGFGNRWWHRLGFGHRSIVSQQPRIGHNGLGFVTLRNRWIMAPYLIIVLPIDVIAVLAILAALRALRRRRWSLTGHCPACGYDLRATPNAGGTLLDRCPECGLEVAGITMNPNSVAGAEDS